jgi:hypothetical protein
MDFSFVFDYGERHKKVAFGRSLLPKSYPLQQAGKGRLNLSKIDSQHSDIVYVV